MVIQRLRLKKVQQHIEHELQPRDWKGQPPAIRQRHQKEPFVTQLRNRGGSEKVFSFREKIHEDGKQIDFLPVQLHADFGVEPIDSAFGLGIRVPIFGLRHAEGEVGLNFNTPALLLQLGQSLENKGEPFSLFVERPVISHFLRRDIIDARRSIKAHLVHQTKNRLFATQIPHQTAHAIVLELIAQGLRGTRRDPRAGILKLQMRQMHHFRLVLFKISMRLRTRTGG